MLGVSKLHFSGALRQCWFVGRLFVILIYPAIVRCALWYFACSLFSRGTINILMQSGAVSRGPVVFSMCPVVVLLRT